MRFDPGHELVITHAGALQTAETPGADVLVLHRGTDLIAVMRCSVTAAIRRVLVEQRRVGRGIEPLVALEHLAVLVLRAIRQNRVIIRRIPVELVRELDVLRGVITKTIDAIGYRASQVVLHAVGDFLVLGVEIPQAQQMAVCDLPAVAVVDGSAVVTATALLPRVEEARILPVTLNGLNTVHHQLHDDTDAMLVRLRGHLLDFLFGADDLVADACAGGLVHVIPVLGELHTLHRTLDRADRDRLD